MLRVVFDMTAGLGSFTLSEIKSLIKVISMNLDFISLNELGKRF